MALMQMVSRSVVGATLAALLISSSTNAQETAAPKAPRPIGQRFYPAITLIGGFACKAIKRNDDPRSAFCDQVLLVGALGALAEVASGVVDCGIADGANAIAMLPGLALGYVSGQGDFGIPFTASAMNQGGQGLRAVFNNTAESELQAQGMKTAVAGGTLVAICSGLLGRDPTNYGSSMVISSSFTSAYMLKESLQAFFKPMTASAILSVIGAAGVTLSSSYGMGLIPFLAFSAIFEAGGFAAVEHGLKLAAILGNWSATIPLVLTRVGDAIYLTAEQAKVSPTAGMQRIISKMLYLPLAFALTFDAASGITTYVFAQ